MFEEEIERKIFDFRETGIPDYTPRDCLINSAERMVSTIIGIRRGGKSFRTLQAADELINNKVIPDYNHICYLDFDNPILSQLTADKLKLIQLVFLRINKNFSATTPILFIFDEIHKINKWEEYVIDLSRNSKWKVLITGSSSKLLKTDISTSLRGKSLSTDLYPFSFYEFLKHQNVELSYQSTVNQARIQRLFKEYMEWGGFPQVVSVEKRIKPHLLREYFDTMILKDIIERYNVSKPKQCIYLLRYLLSNVGKSYTIRSAHNAIKNAGFNTSKESIQSYVEYAKDSWVIFTVPIFSDSIKEQSRNFSKIYCIDWALARINNNVWDGTYTRLFENLIYISLIREGFQVNYYLTKQKRQEIDFIVSKKGKIISLIQVCYSLSTEDVIKRETEPLVSASKYFNIKNCIIITFNEEREIIIDKTSIKVIPAWKWFKQD